MSRDRNIVHNVHFFVKGHIWHLEKPLAKLISLAMKEAYHLFRNKPFQIVRLHLGGSGGCDGCGSCGGCGGCWVATAADSVGLERLRRRRRWQLSISMTTDTMTVGRSVSLRCNTLGHDTEGHDSSFISSGSLYHDVLVKV